MASLGSGNFGPSHYLGVLLLGFVDAFAILEGGCRAPPPLVPENKIIAIQQNLHKLKQFPFLFFFLPLEAAPKLRPDCHSPLNEKSVFHNTTP